MSYSCGKQAPCLMHMTGTVPRLPARNQDTSSCKRPAPYTVPSLGAANDDQASRQTAFLGRITSACLQSPIWQSHAWQSGTSPKLKLEAVYKHPIINNSFHTTTASYQQQISFESTAAPRKWSCSSTLYILWLHATLLHRPQNTTSRLEWPDCTRQHPLGLQAAVGSSHLAVMHVKHAQKIQTC